MASFNSAPSASFQNHACHRFTGDDALIKLVLQPASLALVVGGPSRQVFISLKHLHGSITPVRNDDINLELNFDERDLEVISGTPRNIVVPDSMQWGGALYITLRVGAVESGEAPPVHNTGIPPG